MRSSSPISSWLCSALATAELSSFSQSRGDGARRVREDRAGLVDGLAADVVADEARLARRRADVLGVRADDRRLARRVLDAGGAAWRRFSSASAARRRERRRGFSSASGSLGLGSSSSALGLGGLLGDGLLGGSAALRRARRGFFSAGASSAGSSAAVSSAGASAAARPRDRFGLLGGLRVRLDVLGRLLVGHQRTFPEPAWPR